MGLKETLSPLQFLAFATVTVVLLIALGLYLFFRAFRREPPGILRRSFFDATGQPNGVLLTVFNAVVIMNALTINGIATRQWPPAYVWATWGTIVLLGIGADTAVTRAQINVSKSTGFAGAASEEAYESGPALGAESPTPPC